MQGNPIAYHVPFLFHDLFADSPARNQQSRTNIADSQEWCACTGLLFISIHGTHKWQLLKPDENPSYYRVNMMTTSGGAWTRFKAHESAHLNFIVSASAFFFSRACPLVAPTRRIFITHSTASAHTHTQIGAALPKHSVMWSTHPCNPKRTQAHLHHRYYAKGGNIAWVWYAQLH